MTRMFRYRLASAALLVSLGACTAAQQGASDELQIDGPAEATLEMRVGPKGAVVELDGAALDIPAGALDREVEIRIERFAAAEVPEGYVAASPLFRFQPAGLRFDKPATVHLPITSPVAGARLHWSDGSGGFDVVSDAIVQGRALVGRVEHFSFGFVGRAVDAGGEDVCDGAGSCDEVLHPRANKVDLLLVIDNSGSMAEEQEALAQELPRIVTALTTGDLDGDGVVDIPPIEDLHVGAVSTDMGLVGIAGIDQCSGLGDDGMLQQGGPSLTCAGQPLPTFLAYEGALAGQVEGELACIASLGTEGCGFEQQLESALKALTPSDSPITFLSEPGEPGVGQGDRHNDGFLRNDPNDPSMVAVVLVTDEEDCSSMSTTHFTPPMALLAQDPLFAQDLNLRCHFNGQNLYPVERYIEGLKALRPGNENLVFFAAIVGVPVELVSEEVTADVDFADDDARAAYYEGLLADERMQERIDQSLPVGSRSLIPSCQTDSGRAYPPRRIVEVARGFGTNGVVQSICQQDFAPAIEPILQRMAAQLGGGCTERSLTRDGDGLVACELRVQMPTGMTCDGAPYLTAMADSNETCILDQLSVTDGQPEGGDGWYFDDFSVRARLCPGEIDQAIVFSAGVDIVPGMRTFLYCP